MNPQEAGVGIEEIVRTRRQREGKRECTCSLDSRSNSLDRQLKIVQGTLFIGSGVSIVHPTNPASAARAMVSATTSGESPKPFPKSAEKGQVRGVYDTCAVPTGLNHYSLRRPSAEALGYVRNVPPGLDFGRMLYANNLLRYAAGTETISNA